MDRIIRNVRGVCAILKYYSFTGGQRGTNENEIPPCRTNKRYNSEWNKRC